MILVGLVGAAQFAVAVRTWRRPDMDPLDVPFARMLPFGSAGRAAVSRAMLPWACAMLSIVVIVGLLAVKQYVATALVIIFGLMGGGLSVLAIAWFNRPAFLVPPHRRGETGLVNGWFQRRAASRLTGQSGEGRGDGRK
ncbi:hypothetical protein [Catenulispora sp. EB89]|uniref:hypothetical protein n=1 Tax=Catenulispora sp. EB89 TaxID=3156257 RepID=UPI0035156F2E